MRVLVVDDEPDIRLVVRDGLERHGFHVVEAGDADEALRSTLANPADVAVLDLHLPGTSGLELMGQLRQRDPYLRVIILTASGSEADRVLGLVSGADDYMVKPFSANELAARVLAVGRRRGPTRAGVIAAGGLRIDVAARTVTIGGEAVALTPREFDLLYHLAANPGRAFSRAELLQAAWASSSAWQGETTVTEHVRRLRNKIELDPTNPVRIMTVRGSGYRFAPMRSPTPAPTPGPITGHAARSATHRTQHATVVIVREHIADANPAALALVGAKRACDVIGHDLSDFVAPQSLGASRARRQSTAEGRWPRSELITIVRLDGEEVLVEIASTPTLWDGQPASQITLWDLAGDTSTLRELATGIRTDVAEAIIITDTRLRIQSFNPAAERLYGWREDEVVGHPILEVVPWLGDDGTVDRANDAFRRDGRWHGEIVQRHRDGTTVTVRSSSTLLRDGTDQPVGVISVNRPAEPVTMPQALDRPSGDSIVDDEIRGGIERREFTVHYQPVVRLADGTWSGVEGLVRWQHPDRGLLVPAAFLDGAERSGAIVDLGQLVLDEACRQWSIWQRAGIDLHVAVNLSGRQLADPNFVGRLAGVMSAASMPPGALWLELTETSLVEDLDQATIMLRRIAGLGAYVSIDDFGTGWASLTYLREFPVHALKIDRVFVDGLGRDSTDTAIVHSIVSLGLELGVSVIAEGIETPDQLDRLRELGCELGQGYLFARPVPAGQLGLDRDELTRRDPSATAARSSAPTSANPGRRVRPTTASATGNSAPPEHPGFAVE